jgi:hypothetical protein
VMASSFPGPAPPPRRERAPLAFVPKRVDEILTERRKERVISFVDVVLPSPAYKRTYGEPL